MKTVKFYTLGCKVNQYETQSIRERFFEKGFKEARSRAAAGTCVVNTCTVTAFADRQSRYVIRRCRKDNPEGRIIVTGCLVEKDAASLSAIKGVDFIISKKFLGMGLISGFEGHARAFLKVQDGCNNRCSYCKVPLVRGDSRSRPLGDIIKEAQALVNSGFKEIVLCGICLGKFGKDLRPGLSLADVIDEMERIKGLSRIRLSSIEAGDVSDALIDKMAHSKVLCPHLHIPMQSGDDKILRAMNRAYCRQDYLKLIRKIKRRVPQVSITTDIMVGFPGEGEENFENTVSLVKAVIPLRVHIFPYSPREGTAAADLAVGLTPEIIKMRLSRLRDTAQECSVTFRTKFLNKKTGVLIEGRCKERPGFWEGHTGNYIRVLVKSRRDLGNQFIRVTLKEIEGDFMTGAISLRRR
jgi:threonylcarbamoyladenosine tRNA methylthiotransferase MtaB